MQKYAISMWNRINPGNSKKRKVQIMCYILQIALEMMYSELLLFVNPWND